MPLRSIKGGPSTQNLHPNGDCKHKSGERAGPKNVSAPLGRRSRNQTATGGYCLCGVPAHQFRRAGNDDEAGGGHPGGPKGRAGPVDDAGDGENPALRRGRGCEMRLGLPVLCGACREFSGRSSRRNPRAAQFYPLPADGDNSGDHAVEFSVLAGVPLRGAGADGGECGSSKARAERSAVRAEN